MVRPYECEAEGGEAPLMAIPGNGPNPGPKPAPVPGPFPDPAPPPWLVSPPLPEPLPDFGPVPPCPGLLWPCPDPDPDPDPAPAEFSATPPESLRPAVPRSTPPTPEPALPAAPALNSSVLPPPEPEWDKSPLVCDCPISNWPCASPGGTCVGRSVGQEIGLRTRRFRVSIPTGASCVG
jgi:hypothetical protein